VGRSIIVDDVSMRFRLYHERYSSLKERAIHFGRIPYDDFWALRGVRLEIDEGSTVGLVGANGSGKSTLLKCIAGILRPTEGEIRVRGRLAALLELGAGFQGELTGRENIFLNGSLLGMSQRELARRFDEIVEFAELEQFIDTQVRFYSSGMYVRLGFAIAVNVDPDILLVDEVLAVGDETFQRKCMQRIREFQRQGRTIVLVSHAVEQVRQVCDHAVVLERGEVVTHGLPGEAIRAYREQLFERARRRELEHASAHAADDPAAALLPDQERRRTMQVSIEKIALDYCVERPTGFLLPDSPLAIKVTFQSDIDTDDVSFGVAIHDVEGRLVFGANTRLLEQPASVVRGPGEAVFRFERVPLLDGTYLVTIGITSFDEGIVYDWREQDVEFEVMNPSGVIGIAHLPLSIEVHGASREAGTVREPLS
jgi:ABC-2 type transport system ATP-binding protein